MNKKLLLELKPKELLTEFLEDYNSLHKINIEKSKELIKQAIFYYQKKIKIPRYVKQLEDKWYNTFDYTIYDDQYYFTDLWACWNLYSRQYVLSIQKDKKIFEFLKQNIKSIVDLGCGIGYSTAMLKQMFPVFDVYGTNLPTTKQYNFCCEMGKTYKFQVTDNVQNINKKIDLIFASEYFEHIETPTDHIKKIIETLEPKCLFLANSFNTKSVGHFIKYKQQNNLSTEIYDQSLASRKFNKFLRNLDYVSVKTTLWNNRPRLWIKSNIVKNYE
tara:strand:- start:1167 stop:1985 length:819 start_codon:yes stop_codon:yes gene_type:complete